MKIPRPRYGAIDYRPWEWTWMRVLFAVFVLYPSSPWRLVSWIPPVFGGLSYGGQPVPIGIAQFVDLTFATGDAFNAVAPWIFHAAWLAYLIGRLSAAATAVLFALNVIVGTLANSQGAIHHTLQIVGLVLLGQLLAHLYRAIRLRTGRQPAAESPHRHHRELIYLSQQMIAAGYVITGISKLVRSGGEWVASVPNIALQFEKNLGMRFHDTLETQSDTANRAAIEFVAEHPTLAKWFFGAGLLFELFAFLALWNRATLLLWGAALWFLHTAVSEIMLLGFAYNKAILLIFYVNFPFWIAATAHRFAGPTGRLGRLS